jgi:mitochondrial fission protein ELM1
MLGILPCFYTLARLGQVTKFQSRNYTHGIIAMPVVWLIEAYRAGERGQVRALAEALGWPFESKTLEYRSLAFMPHVLGLSTLAGLRPSSRELLHGPWPDLVISSGVRNEPVCRWIRQQSEGHTRYVHVGKPWAAIASFDAVITTPQYRVGDAVNVVQNSLTLNKVSQSGLQQAALDWEGAFADLPGPRIAVVVGGNSGPFTFGAEAGRRLARQASELARTSGGSLLITTSSRSPPAAVAALRANLDVANYFYPWQVDDVANPYFGILGCADQLVVTADSIAMLSEACATGKPVFMFDLGGMRDGSLPRRDFRLGGLLYAVLLRWFWQPLSRDITLVHQRLLAAGMVSWLGQSAAAKGGISHSDMDRSVAAVRALLGEFGVADTVEQDRPATD